MRRADYAGLSPDGRRRQRTIAARRGAAQGDLINHWFAVAALSQMTLGAAVAWCFAADARRLAVAGGLIMLYAALGAMIALFFPMDPIGAEVTLPGVLHLVFVVLSGLALLAAMVLARGLPWVGWFAACTLVCLAGIVAGGVLAAIAGSSGWPILGLAERLTQGSYLLWLLVLAILGLRAELRPMRKA